MSGPARFVALSWAWALAVSALAYALGVRAGDPAWAWVAPSLMAGPALAAWRVTRGVDAGWRPPLSLRRWGRGGAWVALGPLLGALGVYGGAYALAWALGLAHWAPGQATPAHVGPLAGVLGLAGCVTEELGWRGYLQPRLREAGARAPWLWTGLAWWGFHLPAVALAGYLPSEWLPLSLALFATSCVAESAIWGLSCRLAGSLWPAVCFHASHNLAASALFPALFVTGGGLLLGEEGLLPTASHLLLGAALLAWSRARRSPGTA
ncbi:MAG: CPBP family intramembrane metalloprotease [Alphaproteobacteria bacterium]|nr:CPBP family intramembrane metalloprotease [Alphaproteobacteria bacterium]